MTTEQALQTREETILHHRERLNAVLLHIQENLDAPLTIESLAAVAGFSPYYFHRIFAAYLHETVSDYVSRIRLEWAARRLIFSSEPVTYIALAAGYETPAAFGRAFKRRFNASPRSFRAPRRPSLYALKWEPLLLQPEYRQRPDQALAYIPCIGAEADDEAVWHALQQHLGILDGSERSPSFVKVWHDRPNVGITESEKMRVDVGVFARLNGAPPGAAPTRSIIQPRGRVGVQHLAGGVYAVFRHQGRRREAMWQAIYKRWLPQSDIRLRDAPPYEESANGPSPPRGRDEDVTIHIPVNGSLYELQNKEKQMSPEVQTTGLPDRQMLSITRHVYINELPNHLRDAYEKLAKIIAETGVERDGKPVAIYHGLVNEERNGPVEVGIPVKTVPPVDGDVQSGVLSGGFVAYTALTLRQAHFPEILRYYDAVYKWIEDNGHQSVDSPREVYVTKPMDKEVGMDQPFLEIAWPYK